MRVRDFFKGFDKNVYLLSFSSFLTDVSSEMIFPLLPLFLVNVLGAPVALVGLIDGIAEATANMFKMVSGWWSDKIGRRKPFVIAGYGLSTFTKPFFALASTWEHVLVVRFVDRVGKGLRGSARDAMLADSASAENRGRIFGFRKAMDSAGAVIGPLIVFLLLPSFVAMYGTEGAYRNIFWLSFIPAILAMILLLLVREKEKQAGKAAGGGYALGRDFKRLVGVAIVFGIGNFSYSFFILRAQALAFPLVMIPVVYMAYNLVYSLAAVPAGAASDKVGRKTMLSLAYVLFAVLCVALAYASGELAIWLIFAFYGVFMAIVETVQRAYVVDMVPAEARATALGYYQGAVGFAALPAGILAGLFWEVTAFGAPLTFVFSAVVSVIAFAMLWLVV
ncbi:MAG: MFS transporter [Candidatus Micrarchaeota archaeon]|nr:MFS transporter [Candidatus Micrarchaeota archaeon]